MDGDDVSLALKGTYLSEDLRMANTISMLVLLVGGDVDADGMANELEMEMGLNPTSTDSDEDGIVDGDEDTDGDGVSSNIRSPALVHPVE